MPRRAGPPGHGSGFGPAIRSACGRSSPEARRPLRTPPARPSATGQYAENSRCAENNSINSPSRHTQEPLSMIAGKWETSLTCLRTRSNRPILLPNLAVGRESRMVRARGGNGFGAIRPGRSFSRAAAAIRPADSVGGVHLLRVVPATARNLPLALRTDLDRLHSGDRLLGPLGDAAGQSCRDRGPAFSCAAHVVRGCRCGVDTFGGIGSQLTEHLDLRCAPLRTVSDPTDRRGSA